MGKLEATQTLEDEVDSTLPRKLESELDTAAGAEAHVHVDSQRF